MTGENIYTVLSILNSKLIEWYFDKICPSTGAGTNQWKKFIVETIPIPKVDSAIENTFKDMINKIVALKSEGNSSDNIERELDEIVFSLYDITNEERNYLE